VRDANQYVLVLHPLAGGLRATWQELQDLTGDRAPDIAYIGIGELVATDHASHSYIPAGFAHTVATPIDNLLSA